MYIWCKFPLILFLLTKLVLPSVGQPSKHVILISIDGLRPEFYLDSRWPTPVLQQLKSTGLYAEKVKSVFPSYTYPSHAAMLTGALPARSGIYYNVSTGGMGNWNWFVEDIRTLTLWHAMRSAGLSTAAVQWPVSVGDIITYNIPEIWSKDNPADRISETKKYATKGLVEEIEINATGRLTSENMNEEFLSLDANAGRMAAYIFKTYKPSFLALHFACVDGAQHEEGRDGQKVKLTLAGVDRAVGDILETIERSGLKDSTTVLIIGDHGFLTIHSLLRPNLWLKQSNLLETVDKWKAKFQSAGGSAFLYLRDKKDKQTLQEVRILLKELPLSQRKLFTLYDRKKLDEMGADSGAVLALAAVPGIVFSNSVEGDLMAPSRGGHHGYDPNLPEMHTGFIGYGAGLKAGAVIPIMGVEDIAPLIATLLNINFQAPDGVLLPGIFK